MDNLHPVMRAALAVAIPPAAPALPTVWLRAGEQYGCPVYKPGCDLSHGFAAIARTKTITPAVIGHIKAMGFTVRVHGRPEEEL
jgi:hypothetical protein